MGGEGGLKEMGGGGLINFLILKREDLLEGGGLFERGGGGGLIEDLWYLLFFKLFAVNIQYYPCEEKFADSKISGYVWTGKFDLSPDTSGRSLSDSR